MNHSYRLVWNRLRSAWMVASECARSLGKDGGTTCRAARRQLRRTLAAMATAMGAIGMASMAGVVGLFATPSAWGQAARGGAVPPLPPMLLALLP